jgi:hypothetical protein
MDTRRVDLDLYRRRRKRLSAHCNRGAETLTRSVVRKVAGKLGVLDGDDLLLESESELFILMDFCLFAESRKGQTFMDRHLAAQPGADDADERAARHALRNNRFVVFEVRRLLPGTGLVGEDRLRGEELLIVDELLSQTILEGAALAGRVVRFPEYWITTGACFPIDDETLASVAELFEDAPPGERSLTRLTENALAMHVIRAAFDEGSSSQIAYF